MFLPTELSTAFVDNRSNAQGTILRQKDELVCVSLYNAEQSRE